MEYVDLGESEPIKGIFINGIKYQYSLTKSEKEEEDSLMIISILFFIYIIL